MKPGNLSERKRCQIRRQTKDEDSIHAHRVFGVRFFIFLRERILEKLWKKDCLPPNA